MKSTAFLKVEEGSQIDSNIFVSFYITPSKATMEHENGWSKNRYSILFAVVQTSSFYGIKPFYDWRDMDFCDWAWYDLSMWWFQVFYVHPYLGKWSNLTDIFQMGGWNQLISYPLRQGVFDVSSMSIVPRRHQWHLRQRRQREGEVGKLERYDDMIQALKILFSKWSPIRWTRNSLTFPLCCWGVLLEI